jgi:hypothetical protein
MPVSGDVDRVIAPPVLPEPLRYVYRPWPDLVIVPAPEKVHPPEIVSAAVMRGYTEPSTICDSAMLRLP